MQSLPTWEKVPGSNSFGALHSPERVLVGFSVGLHHLPRWYAFGVGTRFIYTYKQSRNERTCLERALNLFLQGMSVPRPTFLQYNAQLAPFHFMETAIVGIALLVSRVWRGPHPLCRRLAKHDWGRDSPSLDRTRGLRSAVKRHGHLLCRPFPQNVHTTKQQRRYQTLSGGHIWEDGRGWERW